MLAAGRHLALVGLMGAGKTTVGRLLAARLGRPFVDLDERVVADAARAVPEIFAAEGEAGFRRRESECLAAVLAGPAAVLATGGGVVLSAANREHLGERAVVVWLDADLGSLRERVGDGEGRPLLAGDPGARLAALDRERRPLYAACADIRVVTDALTPGAVADAVMTELAPLDDGAVA